MLSRSKGGVRAICDNEGCNATYVISLRAEVSNEDAEDFIEKNGWWVTPLRGHYCPDHIPGRRK